MAYARNPYRPVYEPADSGDARGVARWLLGLIAAAFLAAAIAALVAFQASAPGPAKDAHRRATAALTELDLLLARHYDAVQLQAEAASPGDVVAVPDFPTALGLTREDVLGVPPQDLRALILDRAADRLYEDGTDALRESTDGQGSLGLFSVAGFTDRVLGALTADRHALFGVVAAALFAVALALMLLVSALGSGWARLLAPALILAGSGTVIAAGALVTRLYASSGAGDADQYLRSTMFAIVRDIADLGLRNGIAFAAAGILIAVIAVAGRVITARAQDPAATDTLARS